MVSTGVQDGLVQLSCVLSMLGSSLVILTWAYPRKNRSKHGRVLLLWLSVSDLLSSCIYFIQTFHIHGNSACEINALLGIYFPVASFLWTDCIAFFLYLVVANRTSYQPYNWKKLLGGFHLFVWTLSLITVAFVYGFGHAGSVSDDDSTDESQGNTGGWCWITGNSPSERFLWELIGGKLIEWVSFLIILPYLYTSVYIELMKIEGQEEVRNTLDTMEDSRPKLRLDTVTAANPTITKAALKNNAVPRNETIPKVKSIESLYDMSDLSGNAFIDVLSSRQSEATSEPNPPVPTVQPVHHTGISLHENNNPPDRRNTSVQSIGSNRSGYFNQFHWKLAAVPIVLILIRMWSSLRIILQFARPHADNADSFFEVMQAFFDPSQGIFNALIFVFASTEDRHNLQIVFSRAKRYCWYYISCLFFFCGGSRWGRMRSEDTKERSEGEDSMRERLITPGGGTRAKADSSSTGGHPSLLEDSMEDYECDSSERMSEFSFDLTQSENTPV